MEFKDTEYQKLLSLEKERGNRMVAYIDGDARNSYCVSSSTNYLLNTMPTNGLKALRLGIVNPLVQARLKKGIRVFVTIEQDKGGKGAGHHVRFHLENGGGNIWSEMLEENWVFPLTKVEFVLLPSDQVPRYESMKYGALFHPKVLNQG